MATPIMPVMNFGSLTPSQVSPFGGLTGATFGAATTIADLQKRQAMLEQLQQQNKARPAMQDAQLGIAQQKLPLMQAQTGQIQQQTRLAPLSAATTAQNAITRMRESQRIGSQRGKAWEARQLISTMSPAERATFRAQNPKAWNDLITNAANAALEEQQLMAMQGQGQAGPQSLLTPELFSKAGIPISQEPFSTQPTTKQPQPAPSAQPITAPQPITPPAVPNHFISDEESAETQRRAAAIYAQGQSTSPEMKKRADAAVAIDNLLRSDSIQNMMGVFTKYQGFRGSGKALTERGLGREGYADYLSATEQMPSLLAGSIKTLEGYPSTDLGVKKALDFFGKAQKIWTSNPAVATKFINNGMSLLTDEARALIKAASPIPNIGGYRESPKSAPQIGGTAFTTPPLTVPSFKDKAAADAWMQSLSPQKKAQLRAQMGGGK